MTPECVYSKRWGGKLRGLFCCHVWNNIERSKNGSIMIEKNECLDCGRKEIMILVYWHT